MKKINNRKSFIVGISSTKLTPVEKKFIKKYKPWGIILFSRNIKSLYQVKKLVENIKSIFKDSNYPILIDEEGGKVSRLGSIINTKMFSAKYFGTLYRKNKKNFELEFSIYVNHISNLLAYIGININTVPVLDIIRKKTNKIIGDRSFSPNLKDISFFGDKTIKLFKKKNIGTVIKHIPGHGLAKLDSHTHLPVILEKKKYLFKNDFVAFKKKDSILAMTAHIIYKDIDNINTATHSKKIIYLIRNKINFKNLLITDDISMKALKHSLKMNINKAFTAGCDIVLHCNGNIKEMNVVAKNSPKLSNFVIKKTLELYKIFNYGKS
tara:strand:+ start:929 stop:1897 length:969 start_codon:yes stop_codon:yes gene_type:complete